MPSSRRDFLKAGSAAAAVGWIGTETGGLLVPRTLSDRPFLPLVGDADTKDIAMKALEAAKAAGARYADVRVSSGRTRDTIMMDRRVNVMGYGTELQFGVRALVDGAWGFASASIVTTDEAVATAQLAVRQAKANPFGKTRTLELATTPVVPNGQWETPIDKDPWTHTVQDQLALQLQANEAVVKIKESGEKGVTIFSRFLFNQTDFAFGSTEGSYIAQRFNSFGGYYSVSVVADDREYSHSIQPESFKGGGYGWEAIEGVPFARDARQAFEDARAMTRAAPVDVGRFDVVLDGACVRSVLNSSIVNALEYDRVIGYEMHAGGTSYLSPPDKTLGVYDYGNPKLNLRATGIVPESRGGGQYKWDAEGVEPDDFQLIKNGVVVDYFTTREFATQLGSWYKGQNKTVRSHGCSGAQDSSVIPLVAPTTAILDPAGTDVTVQEMIAATKDGFFFSRGGYASMDPSRMNLQYHPNGMVHKIKNGKLAEPVKYAAFQARTPTFWKGMDMLGGKGTFKWGGGGTGKGDPFEIIGRTVGAPAGRFKQVNVVNYGRRG